MHRRAVHERLERLLYKATINSTRHLTVDVFGFGTFPILVRMIAIFCFFLSAGGPLYGVHAGGFGSLLLPPLRPHRLGIAVAAVRSYALVCARFQNRSVKKKFFVFFSCEL